MANNLEKTVRAYMHGSDISKRYIRVEEATGWLSEVYTNIYTKDDKDIGENSYTDIEYTKMLAIAAGALYRMQRIELIHKERLDDFMKHLYKVPGTNKQVVKKFVRIGEGSIIYSIGHHRFIEMARAAGATYKINEGKKIICQTSVRDVLTTEESGATVYKDVCNPITAEFREELYANILEEFERVKEQGQPERGRDGEVEMPQFSVTVTPFEREGSNIRGLARIYFEDSFIVNNVNILQGKEKVFVSMPSYKTKQKDEAGKDIYQDICYPVTKEFREKLYGEIERAYQEAKEKQKEESKDSNSQDKSNDKEEKKDGQAIGSGESLPFR